MVASEAPSERTVQASAAVIMTRTTRAKSSVRLFGFQLVSVLSTLAATAPPAHGQCPPHAAEVNVSLELLEPQVDTSESNQTLAEKAAAKKTWADVHAGGTVERTQRTEITSDVTAVQGAGSVCWHVLRLNVRIVYRSVMRISREAAADRCLYDAMLRHQQRHEMLERLFLMPAFIDDIRNHGGQWRKEIPSPSPVLSRDDLVGKTNATTEAIRQKYVGLAEGFEAERKRLHETLVDTPEEEKRLASACDGGFQRILKP